MKLAKLGDGPEIFHTIQGEGASAGCPAVFVRTSRCNLHCVWCDTDHTWNFEGTRWPHVKDADPTYRKHRRSDVTIELTPQEVADHVTRHQCPRVVLTGGEPLLQAEDCHALIQAVRQALPDCRFEVETNGTRTPTPGLAAAVDQFNVSPKLSNSGIDEALRLNPDALQWFADQPQAWFKFVVCNHADLKEIEELQSRFKLAAERIILMPEGRTPDALDPKTEWIVALCKHHGFRYGDRLHVRLWGDRRGV